MELLNLVINSINAFTQLAVDSFNDGIASLDPPDVAASIASNAIVAAATRVFPAGMQAEFVAFGMETLTKTITGRS